MKDPEEQFIAFATKSGIAKGMDPLGAHLIGILYIEPEEISLEDLAKRTGYSLASVSSKMKLLERLGAVQRSRKPGSRKAYFFMEKDMLTMHKRFLERSYQSNIKEAKEQLPPIIEAYKQKKLSAKDKKKLSILENYHKQILKVDKVFDRFMKVFEDITE